MDSAFVSVDGASARLFVGRADLRGGRVVADHGGWFVPDGPVTARPDDSGWAQIDGRNGGVMHLSNVPRTFTVIDGPGEIDLVLNVAMVGTDSAGLIKDGPGTLRFANTSAAGGNSYPGTTRVERGQLELNCAPTMTCVPGRLEIGAGLGPATVRSRPGPATDYIANGADVFVGRDGLLRGEHDETIRSLQVGEGGRVLLGGAGPATWKTTSSVSMVGGRITLAESGVLLVDGDLIATSTASEEATVDQTSATAPLSFQGSGRALVIGDGPQAVDLRISATIADVQPLTKRGGGVVQFNATTPSAVHTTVIEGVLLATGTMPAYDVTLTAGRVGGNGRVDALNATGGTIALGFGPSRLTTGPLTMSAPATFLVLMNGTAAGTGYDQLDVRGTVSLGNATLVLTPAGFTPPEDARFTIIANDGTDPVTGTFAGLGEGAAVTIAGQSFVISYHGGDGNDVVVSRPGDDDDDEPTSSYFLAEGATGGFFDDDVLIANPNGAAAPVTLTFLQANAVARPEQRWIFAEGSQGFFDTYILIANANAEAMTATLTFLREGETPFATTVPVGAFARKTVYAGDYPEIVGRAFGIVVDAEQPVIAERSMYFASVPGRLWTGGHVNTGIVAPSTSWFHAEGATGGFFNTFILLSNPQDTAAHVELRFLLDTGEVITRQKTIEARQRLTINPAVEGDPRLEDAAVSTVVQSDVAIVSERSMYWPGDASPFGEGHNSSGVVGTGTRWGLAEGRIGGPREFVTYILLANPSDQAADVTITYLRESGAPIVKTYAVPATSRFNVDVGPRSRRFHRPARANLGVIQS